MPNPYTESQFRFRLRQKIQPVHWQPIEAPMMRRGVPDLNGCAAAIDPGVGLILDSQEIWLELKIIIGNSFRSPVSPGQANWINERVANGGRCFVVASKRHNGGPRLGGKMDRIIGWRINRQEPLECGNAVIDIKETFLSDAPHDWAKLRLELFA